MGNYTHLGMRERCLLVTYLCMNREMSDIARQMGRHRSTLYRERDRNSMEGVYQPGLAHELALQQQPHRPNKLILNFALNEYVLLGLKQGWAPEQISGRMKRDSLPFYTCPESIYRYVYKNRSCYMTSNEVEEQYIRCLCRTAS